MTFSMWWYDNSNGAGGTAYSAQQLRLNASGLLVPSGALGIRSGLLAANSFTPSISGSTITVGPGIVCTTGGGR